MLMEARVPDFWRRECQTSHQGHAAPGMTMTGQRRLSEPVPVGPTEGAEAPSAGALVWPAATRGIASPLGPTPLGWHNGPRPRDGTTVVANLLALAHISPMMAS